MLILSRREAEKVLFPSLGITIEVTRIQGRTVRLGINAPDAIQIIRAELENTAKGEIKNPQTNSNNLCINSWNSPHEMHKRLDEANLAIRLAQNQLRQQLNEKAEEALEHALECLEHVGTAGAKNSQLAPTATIARESKTEYIHRTKNVETVMDKNQPLANLHPAPWLAESSGAEPMARCFA
jgi:carbon storage regulator CsrA